MLAFVCGFDRDKVTCNSDSQDDDEYGFLDCCSTSNETGMNS